MARDKLEEIGRTIVERGKKGDKESIDIVTRALFVSLVSLSRVSVSPLPALAAQKWQINAFPVQVIGNAIAIQIARAF
jgi:hypothetical protein